MSFLCCRMVGRHERDCVVQPFPLPSARAQSRELSLSKDGYIVSSFELRNKGETLVVKFCKLSVPTLVPIIPPTTTTRNQQSNSPKPTASSKAIATTTKSSRKRKESRPKSQSKSESNAKSPSKSSSKSKEKKTSPSVRRKQPATSSTKSKSRSAPKTTERTTPKRRPTTKKAKSKQKQITTTTTRTTTMAKRPSHGKPTSKMVTSTKPAQRPDSNGNVEGSNLNPGPQFGGSHPTIIQHFTLPHYPSLQLLPNVTFLRPLMSNPPGFYPHVQGFPFRPRFLPRRRMPSWWSGSGPWSGTTRRWSMGRTGFLGSAAINRMGPGIGMHNSSALDTTKKIAKSERIDADKKSDKANDSKKGHISDVDIGSDDNDDEDNIDDDDTALNSQYNYYSYPDEYYHYGGDYMPDYYDYYPHTRRRGSFRRHKFQPRGFQGSLRSIHQRRKFGSTPRFWQASELPKLRNIESNEPLRRMPPTAGNPSASSTRALPSTTQRTTTKSKPKSKIRHKGQTTKESQPISTTLKPKRRGSKDRKNEVSSTSKAQSKEQRSKKPSESSKTAPKSEPTHTRLINKTKSTTRRRPVKTTTPRRPTTRKPKRAKPPSTHQRKQPKTSKRRSKPSSKATTTSQPAAAHKTAKSKSQRSSAASRSNKRKKTTNSVTKSSSQPKSRTKSNAETTVKQLLSAVNSVKNAIQSANLTTSTENETAAVTVPSSTTTAKAKLPGVIRTTKADALYRDLLGLGTTEDNAAGTTVTRPVSISGHIIPRKVVGGNGRKKTTHLTRILTKLTTVATATTTTTTTTTTKKTTTATATATSTTIATTSSRRTTPTSKTKPASRRISERHATTSQESLTEEDDNSHESHMPYDAYIPVAYDPLSTPIDCNLTTAMKHPRTTWSIACGEPTKIWLPMRCPSQTHTCSIVKETPFRLCCKK